MNTSQSSLPVAIIGAGPVGLAATAYLLERGLTPLLFEAGSSVGANLVSYSHVQLFSPWRYNIDAAAGRLLERAGWNPPQLDVLPTAGELVRNYLRPLAALPEIAPHLRLGHRVTSITRAGVDKMKTRRRSAVPFMLRVISAPGEQDIHAQAVIDASGTWSQPNPLGGSGVAAINEHTFAERIAYGMPDITGAQRRRYAGKRVLVVGAGHSAAGNLLALASLADEHPATQIVWALRGSNLARVFGGGSADGLPARGALGERLKVLRNSGRLAVHTGFPIARLEARAGTIAVHASEFADVPNITGIDEIICATGSRRNLAMTRELRLNLDPALETTPALAPLIDPNEHSCGTVRPHGHRELQHPEPGYYAVGACSYGRAPTFLLPTGYEQARSVVAAIDADIASADEVRLVLPETGVCSTNFQASARKEGGPSCLSTNSTAAPSSVPAFVPKIAPPTNCCGGPPKRNASACCLQDEDAKVAGRSGCGCGSGRTYEASNQGCCA